MGRWWAKSGCGSGSRVVMRSNYSMHEEVYWRSRLSAAFRTGWACFMAGLILQVGSMHVQWVTFPIFAYVMAVTVVGESTFGKALQDAVAVTTGTAQGVGMSLLVLQALPPGKYFCSIGVAIACISVSSFVITFPKATHILHKRVALAHSGIIYVTAVVQRERMDEVFFPLKLAGTTIVGATCGMLALLVPLPRLAIFQVHSQTKLSARITSERLKVLVDAFCAKDTTRASALNLQAKSLAKIGSIVHAEITSIEGDMGWETRRFPCRSSQNLQRVTKGLTSLRKTLVGLELALQADLASSASNKQTRFLHHMMTNSLIYLTDWVFLALRHASTDIKQQSTTSHTHRQVIIEEGNEVLSGFDEALSATRQKMEYLSTGELDTNMGSILGEVLTGNRSDTDDESHDADDGDISHHTDKDDGGFLCSDSEMIEMMCNTARQQLACRIAAAEVGEAASDQISMGHEIPSAHGSLGAIITHHMQGSSDDRFGSSLMPHTMGAHLSFEAQSAAFFFLFNVKKFVEGTKGILSSSGNSRVSAQALEQSKLFQVQMLEAAPSAQDPHLQSTPHFKVQVSTRDHQIQPHSYMQNFDHHHSLQTGHTPTQFSTSHDHKPPSISLPASTQNASVSQNKPLPNLCEKCIASSASAVMQSKQMAQEKRFSIPFKLRSQQLKTAFKMSLAMAIGAFLGFWFNNKKGYWADITLALGFTGPAKGGSFKIAVLRTLGTVSGSIYGLLVVLATVNFPVMRLVALIPWVVFTSFLRQSKIFGYAGAVSAFTGAIVILARTNKDSTDQEFTVIRIVEAFLGMASFLIVEMLVFPRRAASMVKPEIIAGLGKLQEFVSAIFDAYSSPHCDVCSGSVAIDELKSKERKLRSVISRQNDLVKEAAEEPQFWFAPFPAKIFSKVMEEQGKVMEMLHFSISALEEIKQVAEETKIPMDRLLQAPLKAAMTIMEEKVVPTLAFLVKVMAIRAQQGVPIETPGPETLSQANLAADSKSAADLEAGQRFVELENLMMAELTARNSRVFKYCQFGEVAPKRERRFMDAFERGVLHVAYELEASSVPSFCQGTCTHPNNPPPPCLSNTLFLSLGTLAFALSGLLHHTTELEKVVHELLQEENPWNLIDFWDTSKSMGHLWPK